MNIKERLSVILEEFLSGFSEILRAFIVTAKGLVDRKKATLPLEPNELIESEEKLLSSVFFNISNLFAHHIARINLGTGFLFRVDGFITIMAAGPKAILVIFSRSNGPKCAAGADYQRVCKKIQEVISPDYPDIINLSKAADILGYIDKIMR